MIIASIGSIAVAPISIGVNKTEWQECLIRHAYKVTLDLRGLHISGDVRTSVSADVSLDTPTRISLEEPIHP